MTRLLAVVLATGLGISSAAAAPSGDQESFRFEKGTRWTYVGTTQGQKTTVVQEVFKVREGDFSLKGESAILYPLLSRTLTEGPSSEVESITTTGYLGLESGFFVTGSLGAGVPVRIFKLGSRRGDSWTCTDPRLKDAPDLVFRNLGMEKVTVPAGTYLDARHIQLRIETPGGLHIGDFYIVPGVGIVKTQATSEESGEKKSLLLELTRFTGPGET